MKKIFLILAAAVVLSSQVVAHGGDVEEEIRYATDFPEYEDVRDEIFNLRNGNYTQNLAIQKYFRKPTVGHRDKADAIYWSLCLIENLDSQYVSQELLTSLVESFTNLPETESSGYYSKVYLSDNLQIDWIFAFKMERQGRIAVDIYSGMERFPKKSALFEIKRKDKSFQSELSLVSAPFRAMPKIQKEAIRGMWYALWNFNGEPVVDFKFSSAAERQMYGDTLSMLETHTWQEFCNASDSTDWLINLYESKHKKVSTLERQAFLELVLRCMISGL